MAPESCIYVLVKINILNNAIVIDNGALFCVINIGFVRICVLIILTRLLTLQSLTNTRSCAHPATMDNNELKDALEKRGKSTEGSRRTKIERYLKIETSESTPQILELLLSSL